MSLALAETLHMKRKLVVVEQHMHPCFLCPAKYVEEEFEDDADDCPDAAAESTPRLRCDGIATKHGTLSISSQTPLFAKSAVSRGVGGDNSLSQLITSPIPSTIHLSLSQTSNGCRCSFAYVSGVQCAG